MSLEPFKNGDEEQDKPDKKVTDEEGTVDEKVKGRILKARERVDEAEAALYVNAPTSNVEVSHREQYVGYVTIVQQYIRAIKPLLTSPKIPKAEQYHRDVLLYEDEILPPNKTYPWGDRIRYEIEPVAFKRENGLGNIELPEAEPLEVRGLEEILKNPDYRYDWRVDLLGDRNTAMSDVETLTKQVKLPKRVFDSAVEHADAFLQQAGVGLEIGHRETDDMDETPF